MINKESSIDSSQKNFIIDHELTHINQNHTNNFNSMIKSRIKIMCRSNSALPARLKPLLIIPVALCLTLIFACSDMEDLLPMDNLKAESVERVAEIEDLRNLTEEEQKIRFDSRKQPQNHDVEVARIGLDDEREGYLMAFYHGENITDPFPLPFTYVTDEDFDKLYYHWDGDTAILKLENSQITATVRYR